MNEQSSGDAMNSVHTVFVDTCWLQLGFQWKFGERMEDMPWGPSVISLPMQTCEPKVFPKGFLASEAPLLQKVALLAEEGRIKLFTSDLVMLESFGAHGTSRPNYPGHLFQKCPPKRLKSGFQYSVVFDHRRVPVNVQLRRDFERYPDEKLTALRRKMGQRNLMDCVHLLTACRQGMDFFLCDRRFAKSYRSGRDNVSTWPLVPSELLRNLHVSE